MQCLRCVDVNGRRLLLLLSLSMLSVVETAGAREERQQAPTNFVVVVCDNLGYGDVEPFGSMLHRTPNLNRMAREGRRLTHFYVTAGVCTPSRASLMTGCYSQRVGLHTNPRDGWVLRPVSPFGLHSDEVTIAEVLKSKGYATAIFGKWHLGDQAEFLPTRQGFDHFLGVPYSDDMTERVWSQDGSHWPPLPLMKNETVIEAPCDRNGLTKRYTQAAMDWIESHKDEPFFVYFPQAMPGSTRTPFSSEQFRGKSRNGAWGDSIEELDWSIGVMLDQLERLKIAENTLVIWTSDNGAPINSDSSDFSRGSNQPLFGRGYSTGEGGFRVPAIVWQPGSVPAGTTCDELCTTMDLLPTFAKIAGRNPPSARKIDGHDVSALLYEESHESPYEVFYYYQQDQLQAVRSGRWKLFLPVESNRHPHFRPGQLPTPLLFDVENDVGCTTNLAAANSEVVARLSRLADDGREELGDRGRRGRGQRKPGRIATDPKPQIKPPDALQLIEGGRGGRHWVEDETPPPRSPEESLECLQLEDGFHLELIASEPVVMDPVALAFDENGDLFVAEYADYPVGPEDGGEPLSRIVRLTDQDGDGSYDTRHVFADKLRFSHSLMPYRGGLLTGVQTEILYLKDTDGDNVADIREVMFRGFQPAHAQMQIGNPRWGLDNQIYFNYGRGDVSAEEDASRTLKLSRQDFRFDPRTGEFGADSGMGQFGNTIDRWGNRFYCTNRNPIMTTLLPPEVLKRNPFHVAKTSFYDVGPSGGDTRVFPLVAMKSNYLSHAGTHTSACGVTAFTGHTADEELRKSVFVCEPIGHLVTRSIVQADNVKLTATRADKKSDFLASTDTWFRPASLANGPDGALYIADMYRLWVEHPKFLPPEIAAKLDWRAGEDRGRIYRIVEDSADEDRESARAERFRPPESLTDQAELLTSAIGWQRFLGQRLLVEAFAEPGTAKHKDDVTRRVRGSLRNPSAEVRQHALWTLHGTDGLRTQDVTLGLMDVDANVRRHAVRLSEEFSDESHFRRLVVLAADPDPRVRLQVALALEGWQTPDATRVLSQIAVKDGHDPLFAQGLLTSCKQRSGQVLATICHDESFVSLPNAGRRSLVTQLAAVVGCRGNTQEMALLAELLQDRPGQQWWQASTVLGLASGLPRHRGALGQVNLVAFQQDTPEELEATGAAVRRVLRQSRETAVDPEATVEDRAASIELLAFAPAGDTRNVFRKLLQTNQPPAVQTSAMTAVTRTGAQESATLLLDVWSQLGPPNRTAALAFLLRRSSTTKQVMSAMMDGRLSSAALNIDQRVRLLKHTDSEIRETAGLLFGGAVSSDRAQVAREYQMALTMAADVQAGAEVFRKNCSQCHRLNGTGHSVGPDLSDVRNRSSAALLYEILDPNSKVEPRYSSRTIVTGDGQSFSGIVVSDSPAAIVLRMSEGKEKTVGRAEIEVSVTSEKSLMPEGIEKSVTPQDMANLLAYLRDWGQAN